MASTAEVLELKAHHYEIRGKDRVSDIGQAIDAAFKELVAPLGAIASERFAPHDFLLDGVYHEIKSSAGTWLSIPNSEVEFARDEVVAGRDVIYDIVLQLDMQHARLLGAVPFSAFSSMVEPSNYLTWKKTPDGWVQERSSRVLLAKVKPLLT